MFMTVREFDDSNGGSIWPVLDARGEVSLEAGEHVLWRFSADILCLRAVSSGDWDIDWKMPKRAEIVVTDRRVTFVCNKYDVGRKTFLTGVSVTADIVRMATAKARRHGTAAAGQIRYGWLNRVWGGRHKNEITLTAIDADHVFRRISLRSPKGPAAPSDVRTALVPDIAQAAANWRIDNLREFPVDDETVVDRFRRIAEDPRNAIHGQNDANGTAYYLGCSAAVGESSAFEESN